MIFKFLSARIPFDKLRSIDPRTVDRASARLLILAARMHDRFDRDFIAQLFVLLSCLEWPKYVV